MSRKDFLRGRKSKTPGFNDGSCDRRDLSDWAVAGGVLPPKLAQHIEGCDHCADTVRRVNQVHASLTLLRTQAPPPELLPRANGRALRILHRVAQASAAAARLLRMNPELTLWQKIGLHVTRVSLGVAAAALTLVMRIGMSSGLEQTRHAGEQLASRYFEKQARETGEWFGPRSLT